MELLKDEKFFEPPDVPEEEKLSKEDIKRIQDEERWDNREGK